MEGNPERPAVGISIAERAVSDSVAGRRHGPGAERPSAGSRPDTPDITRYGLARLVDPYGELKPFEAVEEEVIRFAVGHCGGRMSEVARRLGIGRSTLYRKLKEYGIEPRAATAS